MNALGTFRLCSDVRRFVQGVVMARRNPRETAAPVLRTNRTAALTPCTVMATVHGDTRRPTVCPLLSRTRSGSPGTTKLNMAGTTTTAVKRGTKSQTFFR